jgi:nucleotide-binding universal stress UspA family protein
MTYKTILVALNDVSRTDALLSVTLGLAAKFDAHVIGLYVIPAVRVYPTMSAHVVPGVDDACRVFFQQHSDAVEASFNEAVRKAGARGEWRLVDSTSVDISDGVIAHGYQADLIVASQQNAEVANGIEDDFCDRLVMEAGRPVLLVPASGEFKAVGEQVVIGWNGSREAARAVFDALPILKQAQSVWLIWVDPQVESIAGDLPGTEIAASLARHDIKATAEALASDSASTGAALIDRAAQLGADMVVIGAYGHSRMREFVFGGVTRTMLKTMPVPVLMTH